MFTNLENGIFSLLSSILVYFYLYIIYLLYIRKYQLNNSELALIFITYIVVFLYFLFFKSETFINSITFNPIPLFFTSPNKFEYIMMMGNILMFVPFGCLYKRFNFKISLFFIILVALAVEGSQYYFKVGVFDISDALLYIVGFYIGYFYFKKMKKYSDQYNNISYDIRLIITLMVILLLIVGILSLIFF
jgi:glycopeptide antibiotics resistance protein